MLAGSSAAAMLVTSTAFSDDSISALATNFTADAVSEEGIPINAENFPDEIFREYVMTTDTDNNNCLSDQEISSVTSIDLFKKEISDLTGIEHFSSLTSLLCSENSLTELDVSKNTALEYLYCSSNKLTSLDVSNNTAIMYLECFKNDLSVLDVSNNTALKTLDCSYNKLTSLDVSKNTELTSLDCTENELSSIKFANDKAPENFKHTCYNKNGKCAVCGNEMFTNGAIVTEISATLDGDIGMSYYITLPESVANDPDAYVLFTMNGKTKKVSIPKPEADGTYKFTYRLNAKEMHDMVKFAVYDGSGKPVELYSKSGNNIDGSAFEYSLAEYFDMKEKFEKAEMEIIEFETEDVITTSDIVNINTRENELPLVNILGD